MPDSREKKSDVFPVNWPKDWVLPTLDEAERLMEEGEEQLRNDLEEYRRRAENISPKVWRKTLRSPLI